jgi:predicted GIY-YIG superfamily endonuclease
MGQVGTVYLIHFHSPLKHAKHYIGFTLNLEGRCLDHRKGVGSKLLAAVSAAGIEWSVVRTWDGTRDFERSLKNRKNAPRLCPVCAKRGTNGIA